MKKTLTLLMLVCLCKLSFAQTNNWFSAYGDTIALVTDANRIIQQMAERIANINPNIDLHQNTVVKNTKPSLIFIKGKTVNLPFWAEVIGPQKNFLRKLLEVRLPERKFLDCFSTAFTLPTNWGTRFLQA